VVAKELTIGDCYGINQRFGNITNKRNGLFLISHGCEIVSIRTSHFNEFANLKGIKLIFFCENFEEKKFPKSRILGAKFLVYFCFL